MVTKYRGKLSFPADGSTIAQRLYIVVGAEEHPGYNLLRVLPYSRASIPALIKAGIFEADWGVGEPSDRLYQVGGAWYELDRRSERGATCAYLIKYDRLFNLVAIPGLMYGVDPKTGERLVLWKNFDILSKSFPVIREEVDWADPLFDPFFRPRGPVKKSLRPGRCLPEERS